MNREHKCDWAVHEGAGCAWRWLTLWGGLAALAVMSSTAWLDMPVAAWAQWAGLDHLRGWSEVAAQLGSSLWYVAALGVVTPIVAIAGSKRVAGRLMFLFTAVVATGLVVQVIKMVAGRHRPKALADEGLYGFTWFDVGYDTASFPSGHTATMAAVAAAMWIMFPKWRDLWIIPVALVAASRILSGSHFVSDVVAGAFVGVATTYLVYRATGLRVTLSSTGSRSRPMTATHSQSPVE